ncbi:MAG: hypothetical protein DI635_09255 [Pseudoxanthomonas suwonensis]|nr:MAG: hypothetical protein DI635_09255 [Pseudoxanthomonas suwonensis]
MHAWVQWLPQRHPQRLRTGLVLAAAQAESGDPAARTILPQLADLPPSDGEPRKLAWVARAQLARLDCRGQQAVRGSDTRQQLRMQMAEARRRSAYAAWNA